jgi:hypothetical protein
MMKKTMSTILVSFFLFLSVASAAPVEVNVQPIGQSGVLLAPMKFDMTVQNNQDHEDLFEIVISGPHLEWFMPSLIAKSIPAHSSLTTELNFYPTGSLSGDFEFTASAISVRDSEVRDSMNFIVSVVPTTVVKSFSSSVSEDTITFALDVSLPEERTLSGKFLIIDSSGRTVYSTPFAATVIGDKTIKSTVRPYLPAGTYKTTFEISGIQQPQQSEIAIQPTRKITQTVEEAPEGLLGKRVTVYVKNEGNVVERDYVVAQQMPVDPMTGLMTRPGDSCSQQEGLMVCDYAIGDIRPGATAYVTYVVSYWPALNGYILLIALTLSFVVYSFFRVTTPRISKLHFTRGEGSHNIAIHVKNPFYHMLNDVVVKDTVSPLAQVLHEEIESTRPVLRKQDDGGTELIWKLGEIKPREERILQYKVRSLAKGRLKMPGALLKFSGKNEKRIMLASNGITLG